MVADWDGRVERVIGWFGCVRDVTGEFGRYEGVSMVFVVKSGWCD